MARNRKFLEVFPRPNASISLNTASIALSGFVPAVLRRVTPTFPPDRWQAPVFAPITAHPQIFSRLHTAPRPVHTTLNRRAVVPHGCLQLRTLGAVPVTQAHPCLSIWPHVLHGAPAYATCFSRRATAPGAPLPTNDSAHRARRQPLYEQAVRPAHYWAPVPQCAGRSAAGVLYPCSMPGAGVTPPGRHRTYMRQHIPGINQRRLPGRNNDPSRPAG